MTQMRVADYIIDFLYRNGVKDIFMVTGGGAMFLNDAIASHGKMKYVCCHHEQAAAMAADAYARVSGRPGAICVTSGPGSTNAITGLLSAWQDSSQCIFISGQSKRKETLANARIEGLRQLGVLEMDIISVVKSMTKFSVMVNDPKDIRRCMEEAAHTAASGRPGPVWIDVPLDVQGAMVDPDELIGFAAPQNREKPFDAPAAAKAAEMLKEAKRPVIIVGNGVRLSGAADEFANLAQMSKVPVVATYLGIDILPSENPQYVGRVGTKGQRAANFAVQNADLLLCIGAAMHVTLVGHEYELFSPKSKKIIVDIMPKEAHNRLVKPDLYVQSDALLFIKELSKSVASEKIMCPPSWAAACTAWKEKYPAVSEQNSRGELVNSYYLTDRISRKLSQKDVVVCDAGTPFYVVAQSVFIAPGVRYITPGSMGTMGYNLPASIGASVAGGKGRVVCITGDGSMQMNIQELQTIVQYSLPIKIFVINNDGYMSIRAAQSRYFGRFIGESKQSGLSCPDLKKIAGAYNVPYVLISKPSEVESSVQNALFSSGPVIVEVLSPRNQLIEPVVAAERKPDGTMVSKPLHDMFPYLDRKVVEEETRFLRESD